MIGQVTREMTRERKKSERSLTESRAGEKHDHVREITLREKKKGERQYLKIIFSFPYFSPGEQKQNARRRVRSHMPLLFFPLVRTGQSSGYLFRV